MIRAYYRLIKPGIVYGNALVALTAFLFASWPSPDPLRLAATLVGLSFVVAGSCVINNIIDRDIDKHMERTKDRALATGAIPLSHAVVFALTLLVCGFASLLLFTHFLAACAAAFGAFVYLALYTPLKRTTLHSTIVGAFAGAAPPVVGYAAATGRIDVVALVLFLILVSWQMVHFFAIGIFRLEEYRAAGLPIMPAVIGIRATKAAMIAHAIAFCLASCTLALVHPTHLLYRFLFLPLTFGWLIYVIYGFRAPDDVPYARRTFFASIVLLLLFSLTIALP
jgi:protoheme IX farnesyltransferase